MTRAAWTRAYIPLTRLTGAILSWALVARAEMPEATPSTGGIQRSETTPNGSPGKGEPSANTHATREQRAQQEIRRPKSVRMGTIAVDAGQAFGSAAQLDNSLPTLGVQLELMQGTQHFTFGGFARWGIGGINAANANDSGLARLGPRVRLTTALDKRRVSLFITGSAGFGLAYTQRLENNPDRVVDDRETRRTWGRANWHLFAAPGVGFLWPFGVGADEWQVWDLAVTTSYYFTYWLQESSRSAPLATGWLEISLGISGVWLK